MNKILVTGATGFIGYHVTKLLIEQEVQLKLFVHNSKLPKEFKSLSNVEIIQGDITNPEQSNKAAENCKTIYHVAGLYSFNHKLAKQIYRVNVEGTRNICNAAIKNGVKKLIYTSSAATIGKNYLGYSDENTAFNLWDISSPYKKSKVLAENVVMEYVKKDMLNAVILNPSLPIGSYDIKPTPTGKMILNYLLNEKIFYLDGGLNFVNVIDVAKAHINAEKYGKNGERYIIGNKNLKIEDFYLILNKLSDTNKELKKLSYNIALFMGRSSKMISTILNSEPKYSLEAIKLIKKKMFYDTKKSLNELKLDYTPIETGCIDAIDWFKANNYVNN